MNCQLITGWFTYTCECATVLVFVRSQTIIDWNKPLGWLLFIFIHEPGCPPHWVSSLASSFCPARWKERTLGRKWFPNISWAQDLNHTFPLSPDFHCRSGGFLPDLLPYPAAPWPTQGITNLYDAIKTRVCRDWGTVFSGEEAGWVSCDKFFLVHIIDF